MTSIKQERLASAPIRMQSRKGGKQIDGSENLRMALLTVPSGVRLSYAPVNCSLQQILFP
jgi:hypothetical protein